MKDKKQVRLRRARRTRFKIRELGVYRLAVHRTPSHIYAQIIAPNAGETVAAASTVEKVVAEGLKATGNVDAAKKVGQLIAERAKAGDQSLKAAPIHAPRRRLDETLAAQLARDIAAATELAPADTPLAQNLKPMQAALASLSGDLKPLVKARTTLATLVSGFRNMTSSAASIAFSARVSIW